jgi:cytidine deaminase
VSLNPFRADPSVAQRIADLASRIGAELSAEVAALAAANGEDLDANAGGVLLAAQAAGLVDRFGLGGIEELMLLSLSAAQRFAQPPISRFFVGAVGLERETGNLVLGGNLEFPATHLGTTVHGEGFVLTRAAARGTSIVTLALGEAHPCAHCRQYLSEFAPTRDMVLIDPLGHRLTMAELYPWPFDPGYLGEVGFVPGAIGRPELDLGAHTLEPAVAAALRDAGQRAHAPYSKCPGAVLLVLADGSVVSGFSIESVAFNPTLGPLQAALIHLAAHGRGRDQIAAAVLGTSVGGAVDYSRSTRELLDRVAPGVPLTVVEWA